MELSETEKLEQRLAQSLAEKHSKLIFSDLLEFASDVCLSRPTAKLESVDISHERNVVNAIGTRGVRTALEILNPNIRLAGFQRRATKKSGDEATDDGSLPPMMELDTPLLYPDLFSTSLDASIQDEIREFGVSLLEESYTVLGEDVYEKIAIISQAKTADEQMEVVNWLDERLLKMVREEKDEDESDEPYVRPEDEFSYQAYRLSPKVIGTYPNTTERPTCLGVSIIAASFFKQAGIPTLHAGVNMSGDEMTVFTGYQFTSSIAVKAKAQLGISLPEPSEDAVTRTAKKMRDQMTRNDAQHAAVYAKLIDGSWTQFDPNYLATLHLSGEPVTEFLSQSYDDLENIAPYAPGVELASPTIDRLSPVSMTLEDLIANIPKAQFDTLRTRATTLFETLSEDALVETIYNECIRPFFISDDFDEDLQGELRYLEVIKRDIPNTEERESILKTSFYAVLEKYVLWGASPEEFINKLRTDESYRADRIEDLTSLPLMVMVAAVKTEAEDFTPWYNHLLIEFGQPEYRIGAAVLSDFSLYYDFPLPPSFWMSYWPGNVSVVEHLVGDVSLYSDYAKSFNNALYYQMHPFTSFKNSGIVESFLSDHDK